jgi:hypothetical protein
MFWTATEREINLVCHQYGEKLSENKNCKVNLDLPCGVCMYKALPGTQRHHNYRRYMDDLLIIYHQSRIKVDKILNFTNNVDDHIKFKLSEEAKNTLQNIDLSIRRNDNNI